MRSSLDSWELVTPLTNHVTMSKTLNHFLCFGLFLMRGLYWMSSPLPFYCNQCCPKQPLFLFLKNYLDVDLFFHFFSYTVTDG